MTVVTQVHTLYSNGRSQICRCAPERPSLANSYVCACSHNLCEQKHSQCAHADDATRQTIGSRSGSNSSTCFSLQHSRISSVRQPAQGCARSCVCSRSVPSCGTAGSRLRAPVRPHRYPRRHLHGRARPRPRFGASRGAQLVLEPFFWRSSCMRPLPSGRLLNASPPALRAPLHH